MLPSEQSGGKNSTSHAEVYHENRDGVKLINYSSNVHTRNVLKYTNVLLV